MAVLKLMPGFLSIYSFLSYSLKIVVRDRFVVFFKWGYGGEGIVISDILI